MNGNYEWNKQLAGQKLQQRYREAAFHRQVKQGQPAVEGQAAGYWRASLQAMINKVTLLARKKSRTVSPLGGAQTGVDNG